MRTDQLIAALTADDVTPMPVTGRIIWSGCAALLPGVLMMMAIEGLRSDLLPALTNPVTLMKWLLPLAVGLPALIAALMLTRPQTRRVPLAWVAPAVAGGAAIWLVLSIINTPAGGVRAAILGSSALTCTASVVLISALPLIAALRLLRDGASPAPALSGACIGAAAGGFAATIYALGCTEDAPQFFLTWYGLAILITTGTGALAGHRFLRW